MAASMPAVPRLYPDATIFVLGSGPSLTAEDVDRLSRYPVIAINDSYQLAPFAAVVYSSDAKWWTWHPDAADHAGLKYSLQQTEYAAVTTLQWRVESGIDRDPRYLSTGGHSGYAGINLAVHLGARKIVLLGYDFQPAEDGRHHFFGEHPDRTHVRYAQWQQRYLELPPQLIALGITIVNATRRTALMGIPRVPLDRVLFQLAMP